MSAKVIKLSDYLKYSNLFFSESETTYTMKMLHLKLATLAMTCIDCMCKCMIVATVLKK